MADGGEEAGGPGFEQLEIEVDVDDGGSEEGEDEYMANRAGFVQDGSSGGRGSGSGSGAGAGSVGSWSRVTDVRGNCIRMCADQFFRALWGAKFVTQLLKSAAYVFVAAAWSDTFVYTLEIFTGANLDISEAEAEEGDDGTLDDLRSENRSVHRRLIIIAIFQTLILHLMCVYVMHVYFETRWRHVSGHILGEFMSFRVKDILEIVLELIVPQTNVRLWTVVCFLAWFGFASLTVYCGAIVRRVLLNNLDFEIASQQFEARCFALGIGWLAAVSVHALLFGSTVNGLDDLRLHHDQRLRAIIWCMVCVVGTALCAAKSFTSVEKESDELLGTIPIERNSRSSGTRRVLEHSSSGHSNDNAHGKGSNGVEAADADNARRDRRRRRHEQHTRELEEVADIDSEADDEEFVEFLQSTMTDHLQQVQESTQLSQAAYTNSALPGRPKAEPLSIVDGGQADVENQVPPSLSVPRDELEAVGGEEERATMVVNPLNGRQQVKAATSDPAAGALDAAAETADADDDDDDDDIRLMMAASQYNSSQQDDRLSGMATSPQAKATRAAAAAATLAVQEDDDDNEDEVDVNGGVQEQRSRQRSIADQLRAFQEHAALVRPPTPELDPDSRLSRLSMVGSATPEPKVGEERTGFAKAVQDSQPLGEDFEASANVLPNSGPTNDTCWSWAWWQETCSWSTIQFRSYWCCLTTLWLCCSLDGLQHMRQRTKGPRSVGNHGLQLLWQASIGTCVGWLWTILGEYVFAFLNHWDTALSALIFASTVTLVAVTLISKMQSRLLFRTYNSLYRKRKMLLLVSSFSLMAGYSWELVLALALPSDGATWVKLLQATGIATLATLLVLLANYWRLEYKKKKQEAISRHLAVSSSSSVGSSRSSRGRQKLHRAKLHMHATLFAMRGEAARIMTTALEERELACTLRAAHIAEHNPELSTVPIGHWRDDIWEVQHQICPTLVCSILCPWAAQARIADKAVLTHIRPWVVWLGLVLGIATFTTSVTMLAMDAQPRFLYTVLIYISIFMPQLLTFSIRLAIRCKFLIQGSITEDFARSFVCMCCAVAQMARHVGAYKE